MKAKRLAIAVIVLCLLFSITGCKQMDYKNAVENFEKGDFDAAEELFLSLDGYEDSNSYLDKMGWCRFFDYVMKNAPVTVDCSDTSTNAPVNYTVTFNTDGDKLDIRFDLDIDGLQQHLKIIVSRGDTVIPVTGESRIEIMTSYIADEASGSWDIASYTEGSSMHWDSYDVSGKQLNGNPIAASTKGILEEGTSALSYLLTRFVNGIEKGVKESGLKTTMADLGFVHWN